MQLVHAIERRYRRVPTVIVVRLRRVRDSSVEAEESTYTDNISARGACVISRYSWQPGEEVQVTSVKDGTAIRGSVVHCRKLGNDGFSVGLDFPQESVPWFVRQVRRLLTCAAEPNAK